MLSYTKGKLIINALEPRGQDKSWIGNDHGIRLHAATVQTDRDPASISSLRHKEAHSQHRLQAHVLYVVEHKFKFVTSMSRSKPGQENGKNTKSHLWPQHRRRRDAHIRRDLRHRWDWGSGCDLVYTHKRARKLMRMRLCARVCAKNIFMGN